MLKNALVFLVIAVLCLPAITIAMPPKRDLNDNDEQGRKRTSQAVQKEKFLYALMNANIVALMDLLAENRDLANEIISEDPNDLETPLHWAAQRNHVNVALLLLANGANFYARNRDNQTALDLACIDAHFEMIRVLLGHGADPNSALRQAARNGNASVANLLLEFGAQLLPESDVTEIFDLSNRLTERSEYYDVIRRLISCGQQVVGARQYACLFGNAPLRALVINNETGPIFQRAAFDDERHVLGHELLIGAARGHTALVERIISAEHFERAENVACLHRALVRAVLGGHLSTAQVVLNRMQPLIDDASFRNRLAHVLLLAVIRADQGMYQWLICAGAPLDRACTWLRNVLARRDAAVYTADQYARYERILALLGNAYNNMVANDPESYICQLPRDVQYMIVNFAAGGLPRVNLGVNPGLDAALAATL